MDVPTTTNIMYRIKDQFPGFDCKTALFFVFKRRTISLQQTTKKAVSNIREYSDPKFLIFSP